MTDQRLSKQLARIDETAKKDGQRVVIKYTRLDGDTPKSGQSAGILATQLSKELGAKLKALAVGDEVVIVKAESAPGKDGKSYWNLHDVEDKSTFVAKAPKPAYNGGRGGYTKPVYDDTGVKVGASRNQAIAYLAATKGTNFTLDDVDTVAMEIISRQAAQEDAVRNNKDIIRTLPKEVVTKLKEDAKVTTPVAEDWGDIELDMFD